MPHPCRGLRDRVGLFVCLADLFLEQYRAMQISYELTETDFTEAYTAHRKGKALTRWTRRILISVVALMGAIVLLKAVMRPSAETARGLVLVLVLIVMWVALLWLLPWWTMRRQFLHQPGAHGPRTLTLDNFGAHWKWNGGSSDVEWKNYIRSVEGKNQILFYTSPACFNILPKRALAAEQLGELRSLLIQNIVTRK